MKTPFYQVIVVRNKRNITDLITKFAFEDCVDKDDLLVLSIFDTRKTILDDADLVEGTELSFQFGYVGGELSPKYTMRITDVEPNYGKQIDLTIKCTGTGIIMKKTESSRVWEKMTASQIAREIATKYGLTPVIDETNVAYDSLPQGNKTDFDFLKYLTTLEENGNFRFYIKNKELHFTKINLKKSSYKTFTYNRGEGNVVYFKPKSNESKKKGASRNLDVLTIDPNGGDFMKAKVDNKTSKDDTLLGNVPNYYNSNAEEINKKPSVVQKSNSDTTTSGKKVVVPGGDQREIENIGNKTKKDAALNDLEGELLIEGDPNLLADEIITIANVATRHGGNWYVNRVIHQISPRNSYHSRVDLKKNGAATSPATNEKAKDVNNSTGPDQGSDKKPVKVYKYDANGREVK
jgi:phage protein D